MTDSPTAADRTELDIVVFGATGFVGKLIATHLASHAPADLRLGLAGRSRARLEELRATLPGRAAEWPLLEADALDPASMTVLAASARVVLTTVGPYAVYGRPLVEACAAAGTHYVDLTGETLFVRDSIDGFHERARTTGARIVHACGFDSVPSDLGVLLTAAAAEAGGAGTLASTTAHFRVRGGLSGGTIATMKCQVDASADKANAWLLMDDYALSPNRDEEPEPPGRTPEIVLERGPGSWSGPFIMAPFNTQVVRRSNALAGWGYGRAFRYRELMDTGTGVRGAAMAVGMAAGLALLFAGLRNRVVRPALDRLLPDPGEGPSESSRARGRFRVEITADTTSGRRFRGEVSADHDPGYDGTAIMIGEAAVALALGDDLPDAAGVLTPATGLGLALVERLRARGFTLTAGEAG